MKKGNGDSTFKKITNNDIYDEIQDLVQAFNELKAENMEEHKKIYADHANNKARVYWALALATMALSVAVFLAVRQL